MYATVEEFRKPIEAIGAQVYIFKDKNMYFDHKEGGRVFSREDKTELLVYFIELNIKWNFAALSSIKDL